MRGIFEEPEVARARDEAELRWPRAIDSWEALTYILTHDPECGRPLDESGNVRAYIWDGARSAGLPTLSVVYVIEQNDFTIRKAEFSDAKYHNSGNG